MGSWSAAPFGNDSAMDWLSGLTPHPDGRALIAAPLSRITSTGVADASNCEEAIAAVAVIAAAATDPAGTIGAEAKRWILASGFAPDPELIDRALEMTSQTVK